MKLRLFLLASAAVLTGGASAGAADLAVAVEPIDYVKVCDAFGTGYYYIPGSDTCLMIGGSVQLDAYIYNESTITDTDGYGPTAYTSDSYKASWEFKSEAKATFTAKTHSDLGLVTTFFQFKTYSDNTDWYGSVKNEKQVLWDYGYGAIGPLSFGYNDSTFDYDGGGAGYTYDGTLNSDTNTDQLRYTQTMGMWGLMLGLEDPRDRYTAGTNASGDYPDIILAATLTGHGWDLFASGAVTDRTTGTGWATQVAGTVDIGSAAMLRGAVAYSDNAPNYVGGTNSPTGPNEGVWWSSFVSAQVNFTKALSAAGTLSYMDGPAAKDSTWQAALGTYWNCTPETQVGFEVIYITADTTPDSLGFHTRLKTLFNGG